MSKNIIEIKNVDLKYNFLKTVILKKSFLQIFKKKKEEEYKALDNISLNIEYGKTIGLIGGNGAGKSTLLRVIAGIYSPDSGEVIVRTESKSLLALGIGFQNELSGKENIYLNGLLLGMTKKEIDQKFNQIVDFSELGEFINMPIKTYSSGMRSKLAFSIAITIEPELLLIDEVFSVGDAKFKNKSSKKIKELIEGDRTIVMVSHSLQTIKDMCDEVIWLENGKIITHGKTEEVVEKYEKFVEKN